MDESCLSHHNGDFILLFCQSKLKVAENPKKKTKYYLVEKDWNMFKLKNVQCKTALSKFSFHQKKKKEIKSEHIS